MIKRKSRDTAIIVICTILMLVFAYQNDLSFVQAQNDTVNIGDGEVALAAYAGMDASDSNTDDSQPVTIGDESAPLTANDGTDAAQPGNNTAGNENGNTARDAVAANNTVVPAEAIAAEVVAEGTPEAGTTAPVATPATSTTTASTPAAGGTTSTGSNTSTSTTPAGPSAAELARQARVEELNNLIKDLTDVQIPAAEQKVADAQAALGTEVISVEDATAAQEAAGTAVQTAEAAVTIAQTEATDAKTALDVARTAFDTQAADFADAIKAREILLKLESYLTDSSIMKEFEDAHLLNNQEKKSFNSLGAHGLVVKEKLLTDMAFLGLTAETCEFKYYNVDTNGNRAITFSFTGLTGKDQNSEPVLVYRYETATGKFSSGTCKIAKTSSGLTDDNKQDIQIPTFDGSTTWTEIDFTPYDDAKSALESATETNTDKADTLESANTALSEANTALANANANLEAANTAATNAATLAAAQSEVTKLQETLTSYQTELSQLQ